MANEQEHHIVLKEGAQLLPEYARERLRQAAFDAKEHSLYSIKRCRCIERAIQEVKLKFPQYFRDEAL